MSVVNLAVRAAKRGAVVALATGALAGWTATAALADQDGAFNQGEFVVYQLGSYGGGVYDTLQSQMPNYKAVGAKYVNTPTTINDSPDSSKNGKTFRMYLFADPNCDGDKVTHLGFFETPTPTVSWAYTSLGFLNNKATSHWDAPAC